MFAKYETKTLKDDLRLYDDWITVSPEYTKEVYQEADLKDRQEIRDGIQSLIEELIDLHQELEKDKYGKNSLAW